MKTRCAIWTLALILGGAEALWGQGQLGTDGNPSAQQIPVIPFNQALANWNQVDQQLNAASQQYRATTDPNQHEQIRKQYLQMVANSRLAFEQLRVSGVAAYQQAPNAQPEVTKALIGILSNDVRTDDYISAATLANVLWSNKCNDVTLPDLGGKAAYCVDDFEGAEILLQAALQLGAIDDAGRGYLNELPMMKPKWQRELTIRQQEEAANDLPRVLLKTSKGDVWLELVENEAPQTVGNFISLVDQKFYDGLTFHRVLAGFMAQGGCPDGSGAGGAKYYIYDENNQANRRNHFMGALGMAKFDQPNTASSQFYITFRATPHLDGKNTVFGRVIAGFDVLAKLERIDVKPNVANRSPHVKPDYIVQAIVKRRRPNSNYQPNIVREK